MPTNIADRPLSPSSVNCYLGCSARWKYKYIDRLPDPASGSLVRGRAVHKLVNYWFAMSMEGPPPDHEVLGNAYDDIWDEVSEGAAFGAGEDVDELKASGEMLAHQYLTEVAPEIRPAALDVAVSGEIGGVKVRGFVDLLDTSGRIIDLKTASRKPGGVSHDYALQVATYAQLTPGATGEVRLDTVVSTKVPQLVNIAYTVSDEDRRMTERIYPHVQSLMQAGCYAPNRGSTLCSRRYCAFADECVAQWGGHVS